MTSPYITLASPTATWQVANSIVRAAFNASLAVFGILLLPVDGGDGRGFASLGYQEEGRETLEKACEALLELANENPLFDRCVEQLRQLCRLLDNWSTSISREFRWCLTARSADLF